MRQFQIDKLLVKACDNRMQMAQVAAQDAAAAMKAALAEQECIRVVFGAAPSQSEFLAMLLEDKGIDWQRVISFHMDEYVGLPPESDKSFVHYLDEHVWSKADFREVHRMRPTAGLEEAQAEARRYRALFTAQPMDFICLGIGENGHIAFNDPAVARFDDPDPVKIVELEQTCRQQQVNDGCFPTIDQVPHHAITLTVPAMISGRQMFCVVPTQNKAQAVSQTLRGEISEKCPASILRTHHNACVYLDPDSASML